jgi:hypothetical protein
MVLEGLRWVVHIPHPPPFLGGLLEQAVHQVSYE